MDLPAGLYEALLTEELRQQLTRASEGGLRSDLARLDDADLADVLGRHMGKVVARELRGLRTSEERVGVANALLEVLAGAAGDAVVSPPQRLRGLAQEAPGVYRILQRPEIPLDRSDLLVNGRGEPSLGRALVAEIASADEIDVVSAFIKWTGLRLMLGELETALARGVPVRFLTTTYLGSTQRKALDHLVRLGARVAVSYDTRSTRLHAKAWLFRRRSGYHTAYVGSSNLSRAAMVDGQEWNVRLSGVETAHLVEKFRATIDSYWADPFHGFSEYDPERDAERFDQAVREAGGASAADHGQPFLRFELRPFAFQQEILERLDVERDVHGRFRNLVVAATGTGKTVIAAFDYKRLRRDPRMGPDPSLLFVAHRREILAQSRGTFAAVLGDAGFGELYGGGARPTQWRHVFASIQSLSQLPAGTLAPDAFDVVVVDEFHHAEAATYARLLDHLRPRVLLGLTATPERTDGGDVTRWFDGHIAAELRLWEALERDLLCPFHYFGVFDDTDLRGVRWSRGGYDVGDLDNVVTGNSVRARAVVAAVQRHVTDAGAMRALGFCVSRAHARFMAGFFSEGGIPAVAVDATSSAAERDRALSALRRAEINVVFAVDLFNEGVDVPEIDTVLMLRPTESATVFLQQLGRGLRRSPDKDVLTVLDFIGFQNRRFRFDVRYRALTGVRRADLSSAVSDGFPYLPPGCHIQLDRYAQEAVLDNLRGQLSPDVRSLAQELRTEGDLTLPQFLAASGRELADVYAGRRSWTALRRRANLATPTDGQEDDALLRRMGSLLCVDDLERLEAYRRLARPDGPGGDDLSLRERRLATMLAFTLWPGGGGLRTLDEALARLRAHEAVCSEIGEILGLAAERIGHVPLRLGGPDFVDVPLAVHARYTREELLSGLGETQVGGKVPAVDRSGVRRVEGCNADVFTVTVQKTERDYSPTTMYRDYAISPSLLHWESQSTTSVESPTGRRYIAHRALGSNVLLFVREALQDDMGNDGAPYLFLGPARYVSHEGSRPIAFVWRLLHEMPADFYQRVRLAA